MEYSRLYVRKGTKFVSTMPWSEVCMHMRIAGQRRVCALVGDRPMVQVFDQVSELRDGVDLKPFSAPILTGEAGVFTDEHGEFYIVREEL
jgi:hypothetical protein